jgi:hypothetical protein
MSKTPWILSWRFFFSRFVSQQALGAEGVGVYVDLRVGSGTTHEEDVYPALVFSLRRLYSQGTNLL